MPVSFIVMVKSLTLKLSTTRSVSRHPAASNAAAQRKEWNIIIGVDLP